MYLDILLLSVQDTIINNNNKKKKKDMKYSKRSESIRL